MAFNSMLLPRGPEDDEDGSQSGCKLLDSFAIVIQLCLATAAFSTLIYKRARERPQRPVRIWGFDVSKQFFGGIVIHSLNLLVSYISGNSVEGDPTNPCVWYFLNIFVDTTIGVVILWFFLYSLGRLALSLHISGVKSGEYGDPPFLEQLKRWFRQLSIYIASLFLMKGVVVLIFRLCPWLFDFGSWVLGWTMGDYRLQVVFVMFIFPLVMNIMQFWIVDTIVKKKYAKEIRLEHADPEDNANEEDDLLTRPEGTLIPFRDDDPADEGGWASPLGTSATIGEELIDVSGATHHHHHYHQHLQGDEEAADGYELEDGLGTGRRP